MGLRGRATPLPGVPPRSPLATTGLIGLELQASTGMSTATTKARPNSPRTTRDFAPIPCPLMDRLARPIENVEMHLNQVPRPRPVAMPPGERQIIIGVAWLAQRVVVTGGLSGSDSRRGLFDPAAMPDRRSPATEEPETLRSGPLALVWRPAPNSMSHDDDRAACSMARVYPTLNAYAAYPPPPGYPDRKFGRSRS